MGSSLLAKKKVEWLSSWRQGWLPLNLPEDGELRCLCCLQSESRTIKFPQQYFARPPLQHLYHKWLNRKDLSPLHGTAPGKEPANRLAEVE